MTAETTLVLQSPTIVGLGVNVHGRPHALLQVHRAHNAHSAVVRRALVAITDVQAVVRVHAIVKRDDHAESRVAGRVDAHLSRTHVVTRRRSDVPSRACYASAGGVQFVVPRCAPPGQPRPASPEHLVAGGIRVETNSAGHLVATETALALHNEAVVAGGKQVRGHSPALIQSDGASHAHRAVVRRTPVATDAVEAVVQVRPAVQNHVDAEVR